MTEKEEWEAMIPERIVVSPEAYDALVEALEEPAEPKPKLRRLMQWDPSAVWTAEEKAEREKAFQELLDLEDELGL